MSNHTQSIIWAWVHQHAWWWTVMQFFTLFVSVRILRLAPAVTLWGRSIRMLLLAGLMLYTMSYWNSALSVPGFAVIMLGLWLWIEQLIRSCLKAGHIKPLGWPEWLRACGPAGATRTHR
jgi:hypothetical protein